MCPAASVDMGSFNRRMRLKCDGTLAETRFRLSAKRTSPFKSAGALVQSTTGSRGVRISGSNAGYIMFRGNVKSTGYPLHSPVSPSFPLPCVTVCHQVSTGLYNLWYSTQLQLTVCLVTVKTFPLSQANSQCDSYVCFYASVTRSIMAQT